MLKIDITREYIEGLQFLLGLVWGIQSDMYTRTILGLLCRVTFTSYDTRFVIYFVLAAAQYPVFRIGKLLLNWVFLEVAGLKIKYLLLLCHYSVTAIDFLKPTLSPKSCHNPLILQDTLPYININNVLK